MEGWCDDPTASMEFSSTPRGDQGPFYGYCPRRLVEGVVVLPDCGLGGAASRGEVRTVSRWETEPVKQRAPLVFSDSEVDELCSARPWTIKVAVVAEALWRSDEGAEGPP